MMHLKVIKWIGIVAFCLGIVYTIFIIGYKSGAHSESSDCKSKTIQLMKDQLDKSRQLVAELKRRDEVITELTTQYHENIDKIQRDADSTIDTLRLRDDLKRRDCMSNTGDTARDTKTSQCGLRDEDVRDIIGLAARADKVTEQLKACQGILWTLKKESQALKKE